jgi:hypothetical protein
MTAPTRATTAGAAGELASEDLNISENLADMPITKLLACSAVSKPAATLSAICLRARSASRERSGSVKASS